MLVAFVIFVDCFDFGRFFWWFWVGFVLVCVLRVCILVVVFT